MECEQRGLFEQAMAFLKGLEGTAGNHSTEVGFGAATKRVAAMRLAKTNEMKFPDSPGRAGVDHDAGNGIATFACIFCACSGQTRNPTHALYSKELHLLAHVLATARAGHPASVCKAIEDFGEEVLWLKVAGGSKAEVLSAVLQGTIPW